MDKHPEKDYSIIVPTYNRRDELEELLESLTRLDFSANRFEVIISDDGSTDDTSVLIERYREQGKIPLVFLQQKNSGPGAARNHGIAQARGAFFIFIDSDVTVPVDWLTQIDTTLKREQADAFGGPDTYRDDFPPLLKAINYSMTSFLTTGGLRGKKGKKLARFYPRSFNMGLRRGLWAKIGGFGTLRHGQDIEFSHRIISRGAKTVFINNAPVFHKRRTNLRRFYKQVFNWGVARINLYKIDSKMLEPLHAAPAIATLFVFGVALATIFFPEFRLIFGIGVIIALALMLFAMLDAARTYHSVLPALYLPFVMHAQVFGYGLGFIYNFIRRVVFRRGEKSGFSKNYYK